MGCKNYSKMMKEEPQEYFYQLADHDKDSLAEDGVYISAYPLSFE